MNTPFSIEPDPQRDAFVREVCKGWNYVYTPFVSEDDAKRAANFAASLFDTTFTIRPTDRGNFMVLPEKGAGRG